MELRGMDGPCGAHRRVKPEARRQSGCVVRRPFLNQFFPSLKAEDAQSDFGEGQSCRGAQNKAPVLRRASSEAAPLFRQGCELCDHNCFFKILFALD
jgi:hypothetical protein